DDFVQREPQVLQGTGHPDAFDGGRRVLPVAGRATLGLGKQATALVETDGVDGDLRAGRDLADLHGDHLLTLDPGPDSTVGSSPGATPRTDPCEILESCGPHRGHGNPRSQRGCGSCAC